MFKFISDLFGTAPEIKATTKTATKPKFPTYDEYVKTLDEYVLNIGDDYVDYMSKDNYTIEVTESEDVFTITLVDFDGIDIYKKYTKVDVIKFEINKVAARLSSQMHSYLDFILSNLSDSDYDISEHYHPEGIEYQHERYMLVYKHKDLMLDELGKYIKDRSNMYHRNRENIISVSEGYGSREYIRNQLYQYRNKANTLSTQLQRHLETYEVVKTMDKFISESIHPSITVINENTQIYVDLHTMEYISDSVGKLVDIDNITHFLPLGSTQFSFKPFNNPFDAVNFNSMYLHDENHFGVIWQDVASVLLEKYSPTKAICVIPLDD